MAWLVNSLDLSDLKSIVEINMKKKKKKKTTTQ